MKLFIKIILLLLLPVFSIAQQNPYWEVWQKVQGDSLLLYWNNTGNDTIRMGVARSLGFYYMEIDLDSSYYFLQKQSLDRSNTTSVALMYTGFIKTARSIMNMGMMCAALV